MNTEAAEALYKVELLDHYTKKIYTLIALRERIQGDESISRKEKKSIGQKLHYYRRRIEKILTGQ